MKVSVRIAVAVATPAHAADDASMLKQFLENAPNPPGLGHDKSSVMCTASISSLACSKANMLQATLDVETGTVTIARLSQPLQVANFVISSVHF